MQPKSIILFFYGYILFFRRQLQKPDINELSNYIKMKFNQDFPQKSLKFLMKIYQGNLRYLDKILQSFCELNTYLNNKKSQDYILRLSALEQGFLK